MLLRSLVIIVSNDIILVRLTLVCVFLFTFVSIDKIRPIGSRSAGTCRGGLTLPIACLFPRSEKRRRFTQTIDTRLFDKCVSVFRLCLRGTEFVMTSFSIENLSQRISLSSGGHDDERKIVSIVSSHKSSASRWELEFIECRNRSGKHKLPFSRRRRLFSLASASLSTKSMQSVNRGGRPQLRRPNMRKIWNLPTGQTRKLSIQCKSAVENIQTNQ